MKDHVVPFQEPNFAEVMHLNMSDALNRAPTKFREIHETFYKIFEHRIHLHAL